MTTGTSKSKRRAEMWNNQSIRKKKIINNFDISSCRGDDVTWRTCFCLVDDLAVTPVYALWHTTMCARHVSQLLSIILWFINHSKQNIGTLPQLEFRVHGYELMPPAMNRCVKWHHLSESFSARFLIAM